MSDPVSPKITFRHDVDGRLYPLFDGKRISCASFAISSATSIPAMVRMDFLLPEGAIIEGRDEPPPADPVEPEA